MENTTTDLKDKVIAINRVTKVVKGGRRFSFSALVAVGDGSGKVGVGLGKAGEVPDAIRKATEKAKKTMIQISTDGMTIPFEITAKFGSSRVLMRPAPAGTGVIAGGAVRALAEMAGIRDIVTKCHGTSNAHNVVKAALKGFGMLYGKKELSEKRGIEIPA